MRSSLIWDGKLLIFSSLVFGVGEFKDRVVKSRIKPILAFGVAIKNMVAASNIHWDFGNADVGKGLVIGLDE